MRDNVNRYGTVSRLLHWSMAVGFLWMLSSILTRLFLEDTTVEQFLWSTHKPVGTMLLIAVTLRALWYLINIKNRPASVSIMAKIGHAFMYALMFSIPSIALLRQYGSGREFSPFGFTLFEGNETRDIEWMIQLGNTFHSWLGWALFAMIVGHIIMVVLHKKSGNDRVVKRMM